MLRHRYTSPILPWFHTMICYCLAWTHRHREATQTTLISLYKESHRMIFLPIRSGRLLALMAVLLALTGPAAAAEIKILLPLGRTAYQTNEWIDVSVVRSSATALPAAPLTQPPPCDGWPTG